MSGLNHAASISAAYASSDALPHPHARLASGRWLAFTGWESNPLDSIEKFLSVTTYFLLSQVYPCANTNLTLGPIAKRRPRRYEAPPALPAWRLVSIEDQLLRFIEDVPEHEPPVLSQAEFAVWAEAYLDSDPESRTRNPASVKTPLGPYSEIIKAWHGVLPYDPAAVRCP